MARKSKFFRVRCVVALSAAAFLGACAGPGPKTSAPLTTSQNSSALLALLANPATPDASRKSADARLVEMRSATDEARLAVLEQLLYAPGHSADMRVYALDQLAAASPARAINALTLYLPQFQPPLLDHACALATKLGDPRLIDALTRSLAGASAAEVSGRPEIPAIASLAGKPARDALFDLLTSSRSIASQSAALDILQRLDRSDLKPRLLALTAAAPGYLADLQWWIGTFDSLPHGADEAAWIHTLHQPEQADLLKAAVANHKLLAGQADYIAAPRYVALLAVADPLAVHMSRQQLLDDLSAKLAGLPHAHRTPAYAGSAEDLPDGLAANEAKLSRGDLLEIQLLLRTLPSLLPTLYQQGLDDLSDTATEHGGLLSASSTPTLALKATLYPPTFAENDLSYMTPDALTRDTPLGIAQYHFHFQQIHNAERAGPGEGDLAYIRRAACNAVVITSVDTRQVNIDFYTPAGALVDLGTYVVK